jgi:hypothetical protein
MAVLATLVLSSSAGCTSVVISSGSASTTVSGPTASAIVACRTDARSVEVAVEAYHAQVGSYPASMAALTQAQVVSGATFGPWLREVPPSGRYTIAVDSQGAVYVFPANVTEPMPFDEAHKFDAGDPCVRYAS